jgi:DNA-binding MarR family transcriptional regulator
MKGWGFLTNHALVCIHVFENPRSTLREIANATGITERAAQTILRQMEEDQCISRSKEGRRNRYTINIPAILAHQTHGAYNIQQIMAALLRIFGRDGQLDS